MQEKPFLDIFKHSREALIKSLEKDWDTNDIKVNQYVGMSSDEEFEERQRKNEINKLIKKHMDKIIMQEKTLEEEFVSKKIEEFKEILWTFDNSTIQNDYCIDFLTTAIKEAREEGRKEGKKDIDENLRTFVRMSIDNNWQFTEEQVIKAEVAWNKLMESKLKEVVTQYKEELLGKLENLKYHKQDDKGWFGCLSEVKKLL